METVVNSRSERVIKTYRHVNGREIASHYEWLKSLSHPQFVSVLDVQIPEPSMVRIEMEKVREDTIWSGITAGNFSQIFSAARDLISRLESWSVEYFRETPLPPGHCIVHGDFHLGNILGSVHEDPSSWVLVDLDSVQINKPSLMLEELILNIFSHSCLDEYPELRKEALGFIKLSGLTALERFQQASRLDAKYYDYYREFPGFFDRHGELKRYLEVAVNRDH